MMDVCYSGVVCLDMGEVRALAQRWPPPIFIIKTGCQQHVQQEVPNDLVLQIFIESSHHPSKLEPRTRMEERFALFPRISLLICFIWYKHMNLTS
eukprot:3875768-Amphidinium_carterae.1